MTKTVHGVVHGKMIELEEDLVVFHAHRTDQADDVVIVFIQALHEFPDQISGRSKLILQGQSLERVLELGGGLQLADLAHLRQNFLVFRRLQRILILQLGEHHLDEVIRVELVLARGDVVLRRRGYGHCGHVR